MSPALSPDTTIHKCVLLACYLYLLARSVSDLSTVDENGKIGAGITTIQRKVQNK
jgi:hypothetical protein